MAWRALKVATAGALACSLEVAVVGCAAPHDASPSMSEVVLENYSERYSNLDATWLDNELRQALPNVAFVVDGVEVGPAYGGIVEARVSAIGEPRAFRDLISEDGAESVEVEFGSRETDWQVAVASLEVLNDFDPKSPDDPSIQVAFPLDRLDVNDLRAGMEGQHVLVVLSREGSFAPDPKIRNIARARALLGLVAEDGAISMPALGANERGYLGGLTTIERVEAASEAPGEVIELTFAGPEQDRG